MFADTEAEVAGLGKVALAELIFLNLESTLEDFLGLWATNGDVDSNLLITTDPKGTDGVASLACKRRGGSVYALRGRRVSQKGRAARDTSLGVVL